MDELLSTVQKAIDEKKGERTLLYDFHELSPSIDHVMICSAPSVWQAYAITDSIKDHVRENGYEIRAMEGNNESHWVLVDLSSIAVHIFMNGERDHFQLERLYADLPHEGFSP